MSVDTKRFKLHRTEIEYDTYYPSDYIFHNISDISINSVFKIANERGFYIPKLIKIDTIKIDYNGSDIDASAALQHIKDYKFIGCVVLINPDAINDLNENIESIVDKCEFLELNGFRKYSFINTDPLNYILINNDSRVILREIISEELNKLEGEYYG